MPPLTPTSSQEIVAISPPSNYIPSSKSLGKRRADDDRPELQHPSRFPPRARVTERMLKTLKNDDNPITHSDQFTRTAHVVSCSSGHQQRGSDRGYWKLGAVAAGESEASEATYWSVRTSKVEAQSREKQTSILSGCIIAINGPTGPRISNIQLQNLITTHGARFSPRVSSSCTHVVAERLSGTKSQKHINGQGSRGASRRARVVRVEWVLDSVAQGRKLSEAGYGVVDDPTQPNLFNALGVRPKSESKLQ